MNTKKGNIVIRCPFCKEKGREGIMVARLVGSSDTAMLGWVCQKGCNIILWEGNITPDMILDLDEAKLFKGTCSNNNNDNARREERKNISPFIR